MNIIISKTFEKDFKKIYRWQMNLAWFCVKLWKVKLLQLAKPFQKYKFKFWTVAIRGLLIIEHRWNYIPIFITKKIR